MSMPTTIATLQAIQDSEINFQVETFWDMGFVIKLGDNLNGILAEKDFRKEDGGLQAGVEWLVQQALKHFPDSKFSVEYQGETYIPKHASA
jgi:hypothetical protein